MQPTWSRTDGHYCYRFVFAGIAWVFIVSNHWLPYIIREVCLNEKGETIMLISDIEAMPFIVDMAQELKKMDRKSDAVC